MGSGGSALNIDVEESRNLKLIRSSGPGPLAVLKMAIAVVLPMPALMTWWLRELNAMLFVTLLA